MVSSVADVETEAALLATHKRIINCVVVILYS